MHIQSALSFSTHFNRCVCLCPILFCKKVRKEPIAPLFLQLSVNAIAMATGLLTLECSVGAEDQHTRMWRSKPRDLHHHIFKTI